MEVQQVVVLTENGDLQLTSLSRHVLYHTILSLLPKQSMHALLPRSGSRKIDNFTIDLPQAIAVKSGPRSKKSSITDAILGTSQFIPSIEIHKFLDHATGVADFTLILEKQLLDMSRGEIDPDKLHEICWNYYEMERKPEISIPQWFSNTCTYRLWLVFCCVQEQVLNDKLSVLTANEVIKRLVELCGYTWNEAYRYDDTEFLDFPQYLRAIASYFTRLKLDMSLTCEVILDMLDEIVHGVLKKGYLTKKGHKRKNLKKRWFILQRNIMKYFDTRESMSLKGQLILNSNTEVKGIPDKGKRRCWFAVTCGHTGKEFEIFADDHRMKQEWMLAIKKAIALAKVMDGSLKEDDYTVYLTGFYLLKYGTPQPALSRQDSTVRGMKYHATLKAQRKRLSGKDRKGSHQGVPTDKLRADSTGEERDPFSPSDEYMEMSTRHDISSDSSEDSDSYTDMSPLGEMRPSGRSRSMEMLDKDDNETMEVRKFTKSRTISHAVKPKSLTYQDTLSEEDVYHEADFKPRYKIPTQDSQLGGYIEVKEAGGQKKEVSRVSPVMSPMSDEDDKEVGLLTARVNLTSIEELRAPSPNTYLTIVRDSSNSSSNQGNLPPVPVRKSSTLYSSQLEPTTVSTSYTDCHTPPPKPRPKYRLERGFSVPLNEDLSSTVRKSSEPDLKKLAVASNLNSNGTQRISSPPLPPQRISPPPLPPR